MSPSDRARDIIKFRSLLYSDQIAEKAWIPSSCKKTYNKKPNKKSSNEIKIRYAFSR